MKNAFAVFVYNKYDRFIPYYIYTIERVYPEVDVLVFYNSKLTDAVKKYILKKPWVVLYENFMSDIDWIKEYSLRGAVKQSLRHLINGSYFENYENVYFGDVDILILKEPQSLFRYHELQADKTGLPFSNRVRLLEEGGLSKRLTGLHFIKVQDYFIKMNRTIDKVLHDTDFRNKMFDGIERNEEFLYNLNLYTFNFDPEKTSKNKTPMHGFHLGVLRHEKEPHPLEFQASMIDKDVVFNQLTKISREKQFLNIFQKFDSIECYRLFVFMDIKLPLKFHYKYVVKYKTKNFLKHIIKLTKNKLKGLR